MPKNLKRILSKHLANLIRHGVSMAGSYESEEVFIWIFLTLTGRFAVSSR